VARLDEISLADPKFGTPYPVTREDPAVFFHDWLEDGGARGDPFGERPIGRGRSRSSAGLTAVLRGERRFRTAVHLAGRPLPPAWEAALCGVLSPSRALRFSASLRSWWRWLPGQDSNLRPSG
jgi:hypothetical protein